VKYNNCNGNGVYGNYGCRGRRGYARGFYNGEGRINGRCGAEKRYLEPVLVARIYNQPIVEELPYSAVSMTMDNYSNISNICSNSLPCGDCDCDGCDDCCDNA